MNVFFKDFSIHVIEGHISSMFLVVYPDKIMVIDAGCRCDATKIEQYITRKLRRSMRSVKLVVASHSHPDHAGGSPVISRKYGLNLAAPRTINTWYRGPGGCIQHKVDTMLAYHVARVSRKPFENLFYSRYVHVDVPLDNGSRLPGFEDWRAIHAPGHTTHDMVLYNESNRLLYAADVVLSVNGKFLLPFPVAMEDQMRDTLKRVSQLDVSTLLMAHGGVMQVRNMERIAHILTKQLDSGLPPALEKLKVLESFSPEVRKENKKRQVA